MAWKTDEAQKIQREAVLNAIKEALAAAPEGEKHVTATKAYEHYKTQTLPSPVTHFSNRRFLDYIHILRGDGLVKSMTISRGRHGAALMIELTGKVSS